jgi:hypothetical protein
MGLKEDVADLLIPFWPNDEKELTERIAKLPLSSWQNISPLLAVRGVDSHHSIAQLRSSQIELNCSMHASSCALFWLMFWVHSCFFEIWEPDYRVCGFDRACVGFCCWQALVERKFYDIWVFLVFVQVLHQHFRLNLRAYIEYLGPLWCRF